MSDNDDLRDPQLDGSIASYYRDLADAPVPVKLHGRIVGTLQTRRGVGARRRGLLHDFSKFAPAALIVLAVAAIAVAALPWTQRGATSGVGATDSAMDSATDSAAVSVNASGELSATPQTIWAAPTATPSPFPPGAMPITIIDQSSSVLTVGINDETVGQLSCGQTGTYETSTIPARIALGGGTWDQSTPVWVVWRDPSVMMFYDDGPPPASQAFSVCPNTVVDSDASGRVSWWLSVPVVSGTPADSLINEKIAATVLEWTRKFQDSVLAAPGLSVNVQGSYQAYRPDDLGRPSSPVPEARARLLPLVFSFKGYGASTSSLHGYLTFDLTDGHVIGLDELFTSPAAGLAVLSNETRLQLERAGYSLDASSTAPSADNFANWTPTEGGLQIDLQSGQGWPAKAESGPGFLITVPWQDLDNLIKPDSPVRALIPSGDE
jgi:hypothetical protein